MADRENWRPAGPILDELGVKLDMDPDDRVVEVLLLAKTVDMETGVVGLTIASNDLDWIAQSGLAAAYERVRSAPERSGDDGP